MALVACAAGWLGVGALAIVEPGSHMRWSVAVFGIPTVFLLARRQFPARHPALVGSWVGPALCAACSRACSAWCAPAGGSATVASITAGTVACTAAVGCFEAILMAWLWRGYGLISFLAAAATVWPSASGSIARVAGGYPWRLWWVLPLLMLALAGARGVALYAFLGRLLG